MARTLKLPEKVRRDVAAYRGQAERFLRGEISLVVFRAYRVPMGIYEQRQAGMYMVRIRIAAGIISAPQLRRVAELSRQYGNGVVHITTRQDMQIHDVKIEHTPDVLERLLEVGLSSRGGGGNTVRNISACPRAGLCPQEQFDVTPHALALAEYLLQFDSSFNLPRKYKIAFSGCPEDCALASVADLGFFAHRRNGIKGFAVYAGGGLGPNPAVAVRIEDFIEEHEIFEVAEAVKRLFDAYGDRSDKHRARLRYVLARFGPEEFVRLYRKERERIRRSGLDGVVPEIGPTHCGSRARRKSEILNRQSAIAPPDLLPEKNRGFYTARLRLPLGDIPAHDLARIAHIAETCGSGAVRTTQQQDLLIPSVPKAELGALREQLGTLSIDVSGGGLPKVVSCAGASTCRLGLCLSRGLADAIEDTLRGQPIPDGASTTIRISGCPNSCGQHFIGRIGLQGRAKRANGRLMPCYDILCGGRLGEGDAHLAEIVGTLPAKQIPRFIAETLQTGAVTKDRLGRLAREYIERIPVNIPEDYYRDWGTDVPFSLAGRGPGECGAGVMDVIRVDIDEARQALKQASQAPANNGRDRLFHRALLASARALLVLFGSEPKTEAEVFDACHKHLVEPGWVEPAVWESAAQAAGLRIGEDADARIRNPKSEIRNGPENLVERIEELFLSLDANLKFRIDQIATARQTPPSVGATHASPVHRVDLRGVPCPLNFVKAKLAVEAAAVGDVLEIELDEGEPIQNVPASLAEQGQEILATVRVGDHSRLTVRRRQ